MANDIKDIAPRRYQRIRRQRVLKQMVSDGSLPKPEERIRPFYDEQPDIM